MVIHYCGIGECEYTSKYKSHIKQHQAYIHDINVQWVYCGIGDCDYKAKQKSSIKQHQADIHDINVRWHHCGIGDCEHKSKYKSDIKRHQAGIHDINVRWHHCGIEECDYKAKYKSDIKQHQAYIHDINVQWVYCGIGDCDYKAKKKHHIKQHQAGIHDINVQWHHCGIGDCDYKAKYKSHIKPHKKTHSLEYQKRQLKKQKSLRLFLQKNNTPFKEEHQIDFKCYNSKQTFARIDFIVIHNGIVFFLECDEFQHTHYEISCENARMLKVNETLISQGNTLPIVFIRYSPETTYKIDGKSVKTTQKEKQAKLLEFIRSYDTKGQLFGIKYIDYDFDTHTSKPCICNDIDYDDNLVQCIISETYDKQPVSIDDLLNSFKTSFSLDTAYDYL